MQYTAHQLRDMIKAQMTLMLLSAGGMIQPTEEESSNYAAVCKALDEALQLLLKNGLRHQP